MKTSLTMPDIILETGSILKWIFDETEKIKEIPDLPTYHFYSSKNRNARTYCL